MFFVKQDFTLAHCDYFSIDVLCETIYVDSRQKVYAVAWGEMY